MTDDDNFTIATNDILQKAKTPWTHLGKTFPIATKLPGKARLLTPTQSSVVYSYTVYIRFPCKRKPNKTATVLLKMHT